MDALPFNDLPSLAQHLREELDKKRFVLLYAYNGTGKTPRCTQTKMETPGG